MINPPVRSAIWHMLHAALLVACLLSTSHANIVFDRFSVDSGLSQNTVIAIQQDSQGFLWVATQDGLNRWNGERFKAFRHSEEPGSLQSNYIKALALDSTGRLWIGSIEAGLSYLSHDGSSFIRIENTPFLDVSDLTTGPNGHLWIATRDAGLFQLDINSLEVSEVPLPERFVAESDYRINEVIWDDQDRLWVGSQKSGLGVLKPDTGEFFLIRGLPSDEIIELYKDRSGAIWAGTYAAGVYRFEAGTTTPVAVLLSDETVLSIYAVHETDNGMHWFASYEAGLFSYDARAEIKQYRFRRSDPRSLPDDSVFAIYQDHSGMIWLGTDAGLAKFNENAAQFGHTGAQPLTDAGLPNTMVKTLANHDEQRIWIGTLGGGLSLYDLEKEAVVLTIDQTSERPLSSNMVTSLAQNDDGVWVATERGLNFLPAPDQQNPDWLPIRLKEFADHTIYTLMLTDEGDLWLSSYLNGLYVKPHNQSWFQHYEHQPLDPNSLGSNEVMVLMQGSDKKVWIGTNGDGINRFDPSNGRFEKVVAEGLDESLSVRCLLEAEDGTIWACIPDGILVLDVTSGTTQKITIDQGLSSGTINALIQDQQGDVWASTNTGLNRINANTFEVDTFFKNDGLQSNEFNRVAYLKMNDGRIAFGGINGINVFSPQSIVHESPLSRPGMEKVLTLTAKEGHHKATLSNLDNGASLRLTHRDYGFEAHLNSLHYADPDRNAVRYRLKGFDDQWTEDPGSTTVARFTNLRSGTYTLEAMAGNNRGLWSPPQAMLQLTVVPPPWLTWWALTGYVVLTLMAIYGYTRFRTVALKRRNRLLSQMVEERTTEIADQRDVIQAQMEELKALDIAKERFFENISHEFRTPLTLIIGPLQGILQRFKDGDARLTMESAIANAKRLLVLINQLLEVSRLNSGVVTLTKNSHNLSAQIRELMKQFEPMMRHKGIHCELDLGNDLTAEYDAEALHKIVTNLLSNAIKFTPSGGTITIGLSQSGSNLTGFVQDTGPGIPEDEVDFVFDRFRQAGGSNQDTHPGSGLGLALVRELIELHGGSVKAENTEGAGACFTFQLPIGEPEAQAQPLPEQVLGGSAVSISHNVEEQSEVTVHHSEGSHVLLIADDEPDMRRYLAGIFSDYQLLLAADGKRALELAQEKVPDLILSDVMMPEMDGMALLKEIRRDERISHVPVIFLTAKGGRDSKMDALSSGIDDYVVKPFDEGELKARVRNLIDVRDTLARRVSDLGHDHEEHADMPATERAFLDRLQTTLAKSYSDNNFTVADLASELAMSDRQLQRKFIGVLSQRPSDYLRNYRLEQAARLLRAGHPVSQVYLDVGFVSPAHFARCFKAKFDIQPSKFRDSLS